MEESRALERPLIWFTFSFQMAFTGIARIVMQMNSCINPIIYASTIPTYRELVKGFITCNLGKKMSDIEMQDGPTSGKQQRITCNSKNIFQPLSEPLTST